MCRLHRLHPVVRLHLRSVIHICRLLLSRLTQLMRSMTLILAFSKCKSVTNYIKLVGMFFFAWLIVSCHPSLLYYILKNPCTPNARALRHSFHPSHCHERLQLSNILRYLGGRRGINWHRSGVVGMISVALPYSALNS